MVKGAAGILHTEGAPIPPTAVAATKGKPAAAAPADAKSAEMGNAVNVTLGDMWVKADKASVKAGPVMFHVANQGATMHGMAIVKAPAKITGGMLDTSTFLAKGAELSGGKGGQMISAKLTAGSYELICHIVGHYSAGQHIPFKVTN
ncbi:unannotated protein [freshwater metagenome]|uniref:Unannotated protein n=1 Tax=freshwater metagenome TaxID=449393 RepID=A0A6J6A228_9ZZZZ